MPRKTAAPSQAPSVAPHAPPAVEHKSRSGAKVTVACKLPQGLLLRIFNMVDHDEPVMGGGMKTVKKARQTGPMIRINGFAAPTGMSPNCAVAGGYALTPNVDADFWDRWLEQNPDHDAVVNKLIFAHASMESVTGQAKEQKAIKSNLEPIDTSKGTKDPRMVKGVQTADLKEDA